MVKQARSARDRATSLPSATLFLFAWSLSHGSAGCLVPEQAPQSGNSGNLQDIIPALQGHPRTLIGAESLASGDSSGLREAGTDAEDCVDCDSPAPAPLDCAASWRRAALPSMFEDDLLSVHGADPSSIMTVGKRGAASLKTL
jgi:hypothetical protein